MLSSAWAADADPFVLIPEAKDKNYGVNKVDKLTDPNTDAGRKFWNAYNAYGQEYVNSKDSSAEF